MSSLSVSGKNWKLKNYNQEDIIYLKDNFSLDDITSKLLSIRKIKKEEISTFLNPSIRNILPNPNNLLDMENTTLRTIKAVLDKEKLGIFGDYDVDGASSTALLGNYFSELNLDYEIYIPDRKKDGYGPSIKSFKELINKNVKLIFTVDCGTLSFDAIEYAKQNNVDVIVLDHHQSEIKLPSAFSIVNPNRFDDKSNLQYLCAAGVSFMFLVSLNKGLRSNDWFFKNNVKEPNLMDCLDLVSLGTVCDEDPVLILSGTNWHEGVIGIVAARLKDKFNKPVIIISIDGDIGKASARSIVGFDIGSVIISATQENILVKGGGHKMAGGFSVKVENIERFKNFVIRKFLNINEDLKSKRPFLLDSIIAPSAVNLEFYNKVYLLSPFGSGNPEPKFIIEDLKTINGKIVGEKHIKSILVGKDGTAIKSIAFNAVENNLGAYLLKKNNKSFNIAGKLSLNEWKGQSNVEFIIDDISVNKTFKNTVPSSIG